MNENIKLPEPDVYPIGGIRSYSAKAVRAAILADRAARPVADAGEALGEVKMGRYGKLIDWCGSGPDLFDLPVGTKLYRAAPSARTLSENEIRDIADDFKGEFRHAGTTFETFDSLGFARALLAASAPAEAPSDTVTAAVGAGDLSTKQGKLLALADRIDHEKLWRIAGMDHHKLTDEQKDRMNAGVALRRYADFLQPGHWVISAPTGGMHFGASTLDKAFEMAKRDELRRTAKDAGDQPGKPEAPSTCAWTLDDADSGIWQSACGEAWSFVDGGPVENSVRFCQGCGKPTHIVPEAPKGGN